MNNVREKCPLTVAQTMHNAVHCWLLDRSIVPVVRLVARLPRELCVLSRARCVFDRERAVRTVGSVARAAALLVCALMCVPRPVVRVPSNLSLTRACHVGCERKHLSQHHPWKTLSRDKIFCRDRNVPPLGRLYRNTRRPLLRQRSRGRYVTTGLCLVTLVRSRSCVRTRSCLTRHYESVTRVRCALSRPNCYVATQGLLALTTPCCDTKDPVATLKTLSQH